MIEIPGYRILRQLGRGGMASVYLAIQESVDREVALKIMAPQLLVDPNFGERFLREARIAAKLHQRHVVGVHDVGRHGDLHYIAMEYLAGGPILMKDGVPRDVPFALRITREIAGALAYAHAKAFIHRDIKPDNILLRDDGSSALTDFGIARAADSATRMTRTGAVVGTPHYMSPEQARGRTIDGRADLYSLGVVLYELLVGRVPYHAEDSLAVGIMHITEPVPTLPDGLSALQPMLDVMLAKKPDERYQTGDEMGAALREYELALGRGELPSLMTINERDGKHMLDNLAPLPRPTPPKVTPASPLPATRTMASPVPSAPAAMPSSQRAEPALGRMDDVDTADVRRPTRLPPARRRRGWLVPGLIVLVLAGIGVAAWFNQDSLRALVPNTALNSLLAEADKALKDGQLTGTAGLSARELYQAVLRQDADNAQALAGLRQVGERLIADARTALTAGDVPKARERAALAREVLQGGVALDQLDTEIRDSDSRSVQINELLEKALAASQAGNTVGTETSAAAYFLRALDVDPQSGIAQKGLDDIAQGLMTQAGAAIAAGKFDEAEARVNDIARIRPNHTSVPELRARIADARGQALRDVGAELDSADALARAGRFTTPAGDNALEKYRTALARDPGNARALAGLRQIGSALLVQANAAIESSDTTAADRLLNQAEGLGAPAGELRAARGRARDLRERLDIAATRTVLTPDQQQRVDKFLADADAALAAGNVFDPPGGNASDLYRAAMGLDRQNERAKAGLAALPAKARELFEQAVTERRPNSARALLDGLQQVNGSDPSLATLRQRLATSYADLANAQMGEGRYDAAAKSVARARELAPQDPTVVAAEQRLRQVRGE